MWRAVQTVAPSYGSALTDDPSLLMSARALKGGQTSRSRSQAQGPLVGRCVELNDPARSPDRHTPVATHLVDARTGLKVFGAERFSRRISVGRRPSYFFFQLKYVT